MRDEPFVALEDAAMPGVGIDPQRRVRELVSEVERAARREHAIVLPVSDEHGVLDRRQVDGILGPQPMNRDELRGDALG